MSDKIERIEGTITLADGSTSRFSLGRDGVWKQWNATIGRLRRTSGALDSMADALADILVSSDDEDGE